MIPKILSWLLGDSWRTSAASLAAAIVYGAQSVPALLDGTATGADWKRAAFAACLYLIGRTAADISKPMPVTSGTDAAQTVVRITTDASQLLQAIQQVRSTIAPTVTDRLPEDRRES